VAQEWLTEVDGWLVYEREHHPSPVTAYFAAAIALTALCAPLGLVEPFWGFGAGVITGVFASVAAMLRYAERVTYGSTLHRTHRVRARGGADAAYRDGPSVRIEVDGETLSPRELVLNVVQRADGDREASALYALLLVTEDRVFEVDLYRDALRAQSAGRELAAALDVPLRDARYGPLGLGEGCLPAGFSFLAMLSAVLLYGGAPMLFEYSFGVVAPLLLALALVLLQLASETFAGRHSRAAFDAQMRKRFGLRP